LKQVWPVVAIVVGGTGRRGTSGGGGRALGAACWCWRRGGRGEGGTTAADAGATATNEVGRWGRDSTPSSTLEGQLSQPSSSLLSYERGSYQP
jgi:hypothetical protein